jgi:recombination protein RecT
MENNQLATKHETGMTRIRDYILSPEVKERFTDMMGGDAIYYLNQVLIVVANSDSLQKCEPSSILIAAMNAASLKLSVNPAQGQAWIIPYKGKATFQLGYKGVYELAQRTNLYRYINVIDVYEGETLRENRMTGMHTLAGQRTGDKVTARMLYFQLNNGFEKTFVMTVDEIADHAQRYSASYSDPKSKWNDKRERPKMERKTVLTNGLRKWGRFNPGDAEKVDAIEEGQGWQDRFAELPAEDEVSKPEVEHKTTEQLNAELGYDEPTKPAAQPVQTTQPEPAKADAIPSGKALEEAEAEYSESQHMLYGQIPTEKLAVMRLGMKKVHAPTPDQARKIAAVDTILAARAHGRAVQVVEPDPTPTGKAADAWIDNPQGEEH